MAIRAVLPFYVETCCWWCGSYGGGDYESIEQAGREECVGCDVGAMHVVYVERRRDPHESTRGRLGSGRCAGM